MIVGEGGQPLGSKSREAITANDTYHCVFVFVVTPAKEILLRKLNDGKMSASGMAIRLTDEDQADTAHRALPWAQILHHVSDQHYIMPERAVYASVYYTIMESPENSNYTALSAHEITPEITTPIITAIWNHSQHLLPISH